MKKRHLQVYGAMLRRRHINHVASNGIGHETVFVHAFDQPETSHYVERIRCMPRMKVN
jgi:hypothetical protein